MNCKPGDLAVIVCAPWAPEHIGKIVVCQQLVEVFGEAYWTIDRELENRTGGLPYWAVADSRLLPIRDPGDDAQDETLSWPPVPLVDEVTA